MPMEEKRSRKRTSKSLDEGAWDCSVCTFRNSQEAFKCEMCDVRKGTSTRKPRINPQVIAQQVAQQFAPPLAKKEREGSVTNGAGSSASTAAASASASVSATATATAPVPKPPKEKRKSDVNTPSPSPTSTSSTSSTPATTPTTTHEKNNHSHGTNKRHRPPRLKNIDRSSGRSMEVTVGNVTVVITDYKPKKDRSSMEHANQNGSSVSGSAAESVKSDSDDNNSISAKPEVNGEVHEEDVR